MSLNEIFITKMCHDLAGAIGTISNTTELLELDKSFFDDAKGLLKQSTATLISRLKLYRAILGTQTEVTPDIALSYLQTVSNNISLEGIVSSKEHLVFVMLGAEILIKGGVLQITDEGFICSGPTPFFDEQKKNIILEKKQETLPQYATSIWISNWLKKNNMKAEIFQNNDVLSFRFFDELL